MEGCTLGQVLHGSATTTEAIRRAIQRSQESLRTVAKRHGINPKTVAKWRKRSFVADLPTGPKQPSSTVLSIEEEAIVVAFLSCGAHQPVLAWEYECAWEKPDDPGASAD